MLLAASALDVVSASPRQSTCMVQSIPKPVYARQHAQSLQHPLGGRRELVNVAAPAAQRIGDGAGHRAERADDRAFAAALEAAERCRRRVGMMQLNSGNFHGGRDQIIGEGHGARLAVFVVDQFLQQRLADALGDAADDLPLDHRRVDDGADVLGGDIAHDLDLAGLRIDVDHDDMRAGGKAAELGIVERRDLEALVELLRDVLGGEVALLRHLAERNAFGAVDRLDHAVDDGEFLDRHLAAGMRPSPASAAAARARPGSIAPLPNTAVRDAKVPKP